LRRYFKIKHLSYLAQVYGLVSFGSKGVIKKHPGQFDCQGEWAAKLPIESPAPFLKAQLSAYLKPYLEVTKDMYI
jgi:hypothetical protein